MSIGDLIDYLNQFDPNARVFLTNEQASESPYKGDFIVLETLAYDEGEA